MEMARGLIHDRRPVLGQTYEIRAGYPIQTGVRALRAVGAAQEPSAGSMVIRGISMLADSLTRAREPIARFNEAFDVQMQLTPCPTAILDPDTYEILAASRSWDALGLPSAAPAIEMFHANQHEVKEAISEIASRPNGASLEISVVVPDTSGAQSRMILHLAPVRVRQDEAIDVCILLQDAGRA